VDDDKDLLEALCTYLSWKGFKCIAAMNGEEALEALREYEISSVLLDLTMPIMNGDEFLEEKSKDPSIADIPVIVLTARRPLPKMPHVQTVLGKPIEMDELLRQIRQHCQAIA
jgi:DNA-binding response OmpR family regulator